MTDHHNNLDDDPEPDLDPEIADYIADRYAEPTLGPVAIIALLIGGFLFFGGLFILSPWLGAGALLVFFVLIGAYK